MQSKFQRKYVMSVQGKNSQVYEFDDTITLEFDIRRNILASANSATFRIYNLNKNFRQNISKAIYEVSDLRYVNFKAGYSEPLSTLFYGSILECKSYRQEGATNVLTDINCLDGSYAMAKSMSNLSLAPTSDTPEITKDLVIDSLVGDLEKSGIKRGVINHFDGSHPRGVSKLGNTWDYLKEETGNRCFIDGETVNCLNDDYCLKGEVVDITSETGLLGSPRISDSYITAELLFEPRLTIGQQINIKSLVNSQFDGSYKIVGIHHFGVISKAVGGKCKTVINYFLSGKLTQS